MRGHVFWVVRKLVPVGRDILEAEPETHEVRVFCHVTLQNKTMQTSFENIEKVSKPSSAPPSRRSTFLKAREVDLEDVKKREDQALKEQQRRIRFRILKG